MTADALWWPLPLPRKPPTRGGLAGAPVTRRTPCLCPREASNRARQPLIGRGGLTTGTPGHRLVRAGSGCFLAINTAANKRSPVDRDAWSHDFSEAFLTSAAGAGLSVLGILLGGSSLWDSLRAPQAVNGLFSFYLTLRDTFIKVVPRVAARSPLYLHVADSAPSHR